VCRPPLVNPPQ